MSGEICLTGPKVNGKLWKAGDRVAVRLLYNCGECNQCRNGRGNLCEHAQRKPVRDGLLPGPGGLCDYVIVNSDALFSIPDSLPYEQAALSEPLACVVHSIERAGINLADDVLVMGGGVMGQFHVMLAKLRGARVTICDPYPSRRKFAIRHGADFALDPASPDLASRLSGITGGRGADIVFNTAPVPSAFAQALSMTAKGGKMIQYSSLHPDEPVPVSPQAIHNGEITISGSISPEVKDFHKAVRLLSSGLVDCSDMISGTFPFASAQNAFEAAVKPESFRIIITD